MCVGSLLTLYSLSNFNPSGYYHLVSLAFTFLFQFSLDIYEVIYSHFRFIYTTNFVKKKLREKRIHFLHYEFFYSTLFYYYLFIYFIIILYSVDI